MAKKLTDAQFEVLYNNIQSIDEQIKTIQDSKKDLFRLFGISKQTYYVRLSKYLSNK